MKNYFLLLIVFLSITSCQKAKKELPDAQELLRKELHTIDWTKVDSYPAFESCDSLKDMEENKKCFFEKLLTELTLQLKNDSLLQSLPIKEIDTLNILVTVYPDADIKFSLSKKDTLPLSKEIDQILQAKESEFKGIHPATKRGVPVKTQFVLPVFLK